MTNSPLLLPVMQIFIIGFMGSGKTTVAKKLANRTGKPWIDLDGYIEKLQGDTIHNIMLSKGEDFFREIEHKALLGILDNDHYKIISTGGGTPCFYNNMSYMNSNGVTVYLEGSTELLYSRLKNAKSERPLISTKEDSELKKYIENLLFERQLFYQKAKIITDAKDVDIGNLVGKIEELSNFKTDN